MAREPTYKELKQRVKELEKEALRLNKLEEVLGKSKEQYYDLYENAPNAYFSVSAEDGSILRCNTAGLKLLGYDRDTLMGMKVLDLYADNPHGISKAQEVFKRFKKGESVRDVEMQMKHEEGHPIWISLLVEPVRGHDGNIIESRSIVIDITKRKQAEEALQKKTHDLVERVKELNCLYGISSLVGQQDISLEEIIQGTVDLIPPSWQYPEITCARVIIQGREWRTKNFQETIWMQSSDIKVHGELNGVLEIYYLEEKPEIDEGPFLKEEKALIDAIAKRLARIIEHRRAEKALRESEKKYEDLYNNAPIMYLSNDTNGIIIECNNKALDKLGYTKKEIIGEHMTKFVTKESDTSFKKAFPELLKTGKLLGVERQLVTKNREIIDVILDVTVEYDEHGKPIKTRATFKDVTERKQAEDLVRNLSQMLIQAQERERQMISYELHDRIAQNLFTLKIDCNALFEDHSTISSESKGKRVKLSKLIDQTITVVRNLAYDLRPPSLDEMGLAEALEIYCEEFSENSGVEVDFQPAGIDKLNLDTDTEIHLYRLVQEGLINIRKHADADRVTIKLVGAFPNIILRIEDDGKGFNVKARELALDHEKRMGLRSMQERVNLLQGRMTIQSRPKKGTKIFIKFPFKE
jgi:PAS domain S-box-containing protein